jgi:hypothetical protein
LIAIKQPKEVAVVPYLLIDGRLCLFLSLIVLYEKGDFFWVVLRSDDLLLFLRMTIVFRFGEREKVTKE